MAQYMFILYEDPSILRNASAEEMQRVIQRYSSWRRRMAESGKLLDGKKLGDPKGRIVTRSGEQVVVRDGPYTEAKEGVGGYFLIEAADYDEAVTLSNDCPHLDIGAIEIREVAQRPGAPAAS